MGNRTKTKEILLENFIHNVESSFSKFPQEKQEQDEQKGENYTVSLNYKNPYCGMSKNYEHNLTQ